MTGGEALHGRVGKRRRDGYAYTRILWATPPAVQCRARSEMVNACYASEEPPVSATIRCQFGSPTHFLVFSRAVGAPL